jgi:hypothetical protein
MAKQEEKQVSAMQMAECKEVREYTGADGQVRRTYVMELDGDEFELFGSRKLTPVKGNFYCPVVVIGSVARLSKRTGQPYIADVPLVTWKEVK